METADVLACSTGVIGEPVHMEPLLEGLPILAGALTPGGGPDFARAIMTTDTVDKQASAEAGVFRVGGCAKGGHDRTPSGDHARVRDHRRLRREP